MLLFEKLLLILKKKDTKRYNYKAHIVVSEGPRLGGREKNWRGGSFETPGLAVIAE